MNSTLGKILATGLLALEDGLKAFSNPSAETQPAVDQFLAGIFAIWGQKKAAQSALATQK